MSSSNCCFLTCIQVSQEAGQMVLYSHLFQNFPVYCYPHKGFGIVNKAEIDVFLELNIWKFIVHVLLKLGLENFEQYFTSVWDECNCAVVWAFFGIAFLWDWKENWPFPVLWPLLSFPNLQTIWTASNSPKINRSIQESGLELLKVIICCLPDTVFEKFTELIFQKLHSSIID